MPKDYFNPAFISLIEIVVEDKLYSNISPSSTQQVNVDNITERIVNKLKKHFESGHLRQ
jgi:hypothetical protein